MPDSDEDVARLVVRAVAALIAFVLAAGIALVLRDSSASEADDVPVVGGEPVLAGGAPLAGTDVPSYVVRRRGALANLDGRVVATVSFDRYLVEDEARRLLDGVKVRALLAAAPGSEPAVVTGSLRQWADQVQAEAEVERANLDRMAQDTQDPAFVSQFQADQARLTALVERIDPAAPVVFGAVVDGDVADLRVVQGRAGVRLVDPMARRADGDELARFGGVRPEETARAGEPPYRPL